MATRSRTSFQKRQKEIARQEKQRDKAARRQQRKLAGPAPVDEFGETIEAADAADATGEPSEPADSHHEENN